jgi:hypothetical protein
MGAADGSGSREASSDPAANDPSGVGPLTALAFELGLELQSVSQCGKQVASYVGLVPSEESPTIYQKKGAGRRKKRQLDPPTQPRSRKVV